jgi:hypothetical protein
MLCFLLITSIIPIAQARPLEQTSLPSTISVDMFVLNTTTSAKVLPEQRCASSSSTATAYGCTWASDAPYPYTSNPVTLNIEGDYLLDVMPRESNPEEGFLLPALKAQAVAARSYAFYKISINDVIDNSVNDQVFVPYFFDRLGYFPGPGGIDPPTNRIPVNINPCTDGFFSPTNPATYEQRVVCQAAADKQYISPGTNNTSAFAEFSADRLEGRTVTGGPSYQVSVEDPISAQAGTICPYNENDIDLANGSHGRGMLQRGANRWARGSRCWISEIYEEDPWSVRWTNRDQILTHYYTGIHIRDVATRAIRTPTYRWVPLRIDWGTSNDRPPIFTAGGGYTINVQVQNTSTAAWSCGSPPNLAYNLTYRWVGQTTYDGAQRVSVCGLTPGAAGTVPLTLSDIPDLPGNYSLQFDITVTTSTGSFKFSDPGYGWSSYKQNVRVCPGGVCAPRQRDFVFVIDTTQSMNDNLADLKMASNNIVNGLLQSGDDVRIAVVDYIATFLRVHTAVLEIMRHVWFSISRLIRPKLLTLSTA